ncbi:MAG: DUF2269 domain-containing protein [Gammaproteobacteria bacterium]|nr:DUF2269 domain-containing protein [Gammaproteobacteria bacterium]
MTYLILKYVHILAAVVVAGTGTGIAFFMFTAIRSKDAHLIRVTARNVVRADWLFTTPAIVVQIATGIALMQVLGIAWTGTWSMTVLVLYAIVAGCWIPVVVIQYRMRDSVDVEDARFRTLARTWIILGAIAFTIILVLFWLMVARPLSLSFSVQ